MPNKKQDKSIVVAGDVTMDWNIATPHGSKRVNPIWSQDVSSSISWQRGGSAMLGDLLNEIAKDLDRSGTPQFSIRQIDAPRKSDKVHPDSDQYHHSYVKWSPFKYRDKTAWRVEEFLGLNHAARVSVQDWQKVVDDSPEAELVVLEDADLGFRDQPDLWPIALRNKGKNRPWVLLKVTQPLAQGLLWEHLHHDFSDRLIVITGVDDLRLSEVQISRELSWERTAQDIFWELIHNPCINSLSHCAHVIISFGLAGAILLSRQQEKVLPPFQCSLFFDPKVIEQMWEKDNPGGMVGIHTCLAASLARQWMLSPNKPDLQLGIQSGLAAMRTLHLEGYGEQGTPLSQVNLVFPIERIAAALSKPASQFTVTPVEDPMRFIQHKGGLTAKPLTEGFWTILQDKFRGGLDLVAKQVVLEGPDIPLQGVPWGQFGNLLTVDRQEIESYRSIRNLVAEYAGQKQATRPLSIAVFGSPGSGKSFGVTEMAKSLLPGQIEPITFNLSQFDSVEGLLSAFHQVRDVGLSGKIPLVFWDEFDTSLGEIPLGWLRYFLAPMQDGKFQDGQISHPIGRAIFVFAGGTSSSMAEFDQGTKVEFKAAKGPDFVSRLKGYINVLGPNPVKGVDADPFFIIRRAILLRSSLKRSAPQLFEKRNGKEVLKIDQGVLRALLKVGHYKHGARSIESLFAMSQLTGKTAFERSSLPAESQLDLHVNGKQFLSLVQQVELEGQMLENLAEAAHQVYSEGMKARGFHYGPITDEKHKIHNALLPYADLTEELKEQNRQNVRDIPIKLASAGYVMIPARSNEPPFNFPGKPLEFLAEAEHERWMLSKLEDGWAFAPKTDKTKKLHKYLVPWEKLPEEEKEKDRDMVRGIPEILARAGYAIIKVND
jgi:hypothetical protein